MTFNKYMNLPTHKMGNQINIVFSYNILRNMEKLLPFYSFAGLKNKQTFFQ